MSRRVCNKPRFPTPTAARKFAQLENQVVSNIYFCVKCDAYHLTRVRFKHNRRR